VWDVLDLLYNYYVAVDVVMLNINIKLFYKTISTNNRERNVDNVVSRLVKEIKTKEYDGPDKKEIRHAITFLGWLVKEIQKELKRHREKEQKLNDNELAHELVIILKNKEGNQRLELKPRHGTGVKWKREKVSPSKE